jgi:hypothetical protein
MTLLMPDLGRALPLPQALKRTGPVRVPLRDILRRESAPVPYLSAVVVSLEIKTLQAHEPPALEFSVELRNTGDQPVELYFVPDEDIMVTLAEKGRLPRVPVGYRFLNLFGPQGPVEPATEAPTLELAPSEASQVRRHVDEALVEDEDTDRPSEALAPPERVPILAGEYFVHVGVRLVTRVDDRWVFRGVSTGLAVTFK